MKASRSSADASTEPTSAAKGSRTTTTADTTESLETSESPESLENLEASASSAANTDETDLPTIQDVWRAQDVLREHVYHTPLLDSRTLSAMTGATVYLKAENLQRTGSYKVRGATYKLSRLSPEQRTHGVIAASAGNHAQGVAMAAHALGIECVIVMPATAPLAKVAATEHYGAKVVQAGATYDDAYATACEMRDATGATYIHAFDDRDIIAGQGTVGLEILADLPSVEAIVLPIGGGGLISGVATVVKALRPDVRIIGVEAAGAAAMKQSLDAGRLVTLDSIATIADGIALKAPGGRTLAITRKLVDEVVTVSDDDIIRTVLLLMERCKQMVEGSGAVSVAALLAGSVKLPGLNTVAVLSGGNIDMTVVGRFIARGLALQGRYLSIRSRIVDRPGELLRLLEVIAEQKVNVMEVTHHRVGPYVPIQHVDVSLTLETRDREHCDQLMASLRERGFQVVAETSLF